MYLLSTLKFIVQHPLNKGRKVQALLGFLKWQIGSRLVPGEIIYHWINDAKFIVQPGETALTQNIYCGLMEFHDMAYVLHVLNSEDLFIDVGANVGSYTILACAVKGARGYCFEPIPSTFQRLINNIKLNDLMDRVKSYNIGLGDKEGDLFFTTNLNCSNHMLADGESIINAVKVKILSLDTVLANESPAVIKIDVEGLESLVINGMLHTLENPSLHSVIMELNGSGRRYGFNDERIIEKMLGFGFRMYTYEPFSKSLKPVLKKNENMGNVLFLRNVDFISQRLANASCIKIGSMKI